MNISINPKNGNYVMRNVNLCWINFDGHGTKANPEGGKRGFGIIIKGCEEQTVEEQYEILTDAGLPLKEHGESTPECPIWVLPVAIRYHHGQYESLNPIIIEDRINGQSFVWNEENLNLLQGARITDIKVSINCSHWEHGGRSGVKAYLSSMHFTLIPRDDFADDYDEFEENPFND